MLRVSSSLTRYAGKHARALSTFQWSGQKGFTIQTYSDSSYSSTHKARFSTMTDNSMMGDEMIDEEDEEYYSDFELSDEHRKLLENSVLRFKSGIEPPDQLVERLHEVLEGRSTKHLADDYEMMMKRDNDRLPAAKNLPAVGWSLSGAAAAKNTPALVYGPRQTLAYCASRGLVSYALCFRVMEELSRCAPDLEPRDVLDVGSGLGTAAWSFASVWGMEQLRLYRGVDPSRSMADVSEQLLEGFPGVSLRSSLSEIVRANELESQYDLAISAFTLSELRNDLARAAAVTQMWRSLRPGGVLVLVERGHPFGSHTVRSARELVLEASSGGGEGQQGYVLAPCAHDGKCPMKGTTWCSFTQRAPLLVSNSRRLHRDSMEKFSYVIIRKGIREGVTTHQFAHDQHEEAEGLAQAQDHGFSPDWTWDWSSFQFRTSRSHLNQVTRAQKKQEAEAAEAAERAKREAERRAREAAAEAKRIAEEEEAARTRGRLRTRVRRGLLLKKEREEREARGEGGGEEGDEGGLEAGDEEDEEDGKQVEEASTGGRMITGVDRSGDLSLPLPEWGRIVRQPMKAGHHVTMDLCTPKGTLDRRVLTRKHVRAAMGRIGYRAARKSAWGGLWPF